MFRALICLGLLASASAQTVRNVQPGADAIEAATRKLASLCDQTTKTDHEEAALLKNEPSREVQIALNSESALLQFLTDPTTNYPDRMAAAFRGSDLISPEELPNLWKASADLARLGNGMWPSPCYYIMSDNLGPRDWLVRSQRRPLSSQGPESIVILGRVVQPAARMIDYPVTMDERNRAPWLGQMSRALPILMNAVAARYASAELYPKLADAARRWQPSNAYESTARATAIRRGPRNALWVETLTRVALEDTDKNAAASAAKDLWVDAHDTLHMEELLQAAQIAILRMTTEEEVAAKATTGVLQTATIRNAKVYPFGLSAELKNLRSATAMLEISRWIADGSFDLYNQYYAFAVPLCKLADHPPFACDRAVQPGSPELQDIMGRLAQWFKEEHESLERKAMLERPGLLSLWGELHANVK